MPIKKLDFKFINELHRNDHIQEIMDVVNNNASEQANLVSTVQDLYRGFSGNNSSTKKIYCHPISTRFQRGTQLLAQFSCLIFDNNPNAYTWETFVEKVASISENDREAVIMASGYVYDGETPNYSIVISHLSYNTSLSAITCEGIKNSDGSSNYFTMATGSLTFAYFGDGVNAIN